MECHFDTKYWDLFYFQIEPPVPIYFNYYFMHVENSEAFANGTDAKPRVREMGPYSFLEYRVKKQVLQIGLDMINYGQYYEFYYDQENTNV